MKKKILYITLAAFILGTGSCKKDSEFLNAPQPIGSPLDANNVFNDPPLALAAIGQLYNRIVDFSGLDNGWASFADFGDAFPSETGQYGIVQRNGWGFDTWSNWDYTYIRELNLYIERMTASTGITGADKTRFIAEARFLRALQYFELVKRMGGVPIITKSLTLDPNNVSAIQFARSKESEVYDFVISEMDAIKDLLPKGPATKSRATGGAALAVIARAGVYAGSIARYGANTPTVRLPGDIVGIPASMAADYYTKALNAAQLLTGGTYGAYKLYQNSPNLSDNYAAIFTDKGAGNPESIFIEDFKVFAGKVHGFTTNDQPYSNGEEIDDAGRLNPSLNLVQQFELLDNTSAPLVTRDGTGAPVAYTGIQDIFAGRDARLAGTVLLPGAVWKNAANDIWAGYWTPGAGVAFEQGTITTAPTAATADYKVIPGGTTPIQVVGKDGPVNNWQFHTQTGFYTRKWLDPNVGTGRRGQGSDVPFIRYRYSEVLLNAAEAAAELGQYTVASGYINQVRARAGFATPLVLTSNNYFERIVHERHVELCFEGHTLFDAKRWRIATQIWNGQKLTVTDLLSNLTSPVKAQTQPWGLWPYKVNTGPNNGKWIFKEVLPSVVTGASLFLTGNYYSKIADNILGANPKLVRQPNQ